MNVIIFLIISFFVITFIGCYINKKDKYYKNKIEELKVQINWYKKELEKYEFKRYK